VAVQGPTGWWITRTPQLNTARKVIPTAIRPSGCISQSKNLLIMDAPEMNFKRLAAIEFTAAGAELP
jgi:hypothetical protein